MYSIILLTLSLLFILLLNARFNYLNDDIQEHRRTAAVVLIVTILVSIMFYIEASYAIIKANEFALKATAITGMLILHAYIIKEVVEEIITIRAISKYDNKRIK